MALSPFLAFPPRTDPNFSTYVNDFFTSKLPLFVDELNETVVGFNNGSFTGTSTSSVSIDGTLGKTFITQSGLSFQKGMYVSIISTATADTSNRMIAIVRSYSGTSLVVDPVSFAGTGPIASWRISIVPPAVAVTKSEIKLETGAGYGSTNTFVRNFLTTAITTGSAITGGPNAVSGASFTIQTTGIYAVSYQDAGTTTAACISKNSASGVAAPGFADRLAVATTTGQFSTANYIGSLTAGDIIRAHPSAIGLTTTTGVYFHIVKLAAG